MNFEPAGPLRTSSNLAAPRAVDDGVAADDGITADGFETISDLVAELIEATEHRPARPAGRGPRTSRDRRSSPRHCKTRAMHTPTASPARSHAAYGFPFIDLSEERASPSAAELIPLKTLQRVVAVPMSRTDDRLRVAVADPANIHGIDELRLATRYTVDIGVANREEILVELERLARQNDAMDAQSALDEFEVVEDETISKSTTASRMRRS